MKTVIIKWHPLWSEMSMTTLLTHISNLYSKSSEHPLHNRILLSTPEERITQFYMIKCGFGQNGIFASGIVDISSGWPHIHNQNTYFCHSIRQHFKTFLNPSAFPILPIDELSTTFPSYNWKNEVAIELTEEDSQTLDDLWLFHLERNKDLINDENKASDVYYHNTNLQIDKMTTYQDKAILIKWRPRTSSLKKEDFMRLLTEQMSNHPWEREKPIKWYWPMKNPDIFSRNDTVFVVMQDEKFSGLFLAGFTCSIPDAAPSCRKDGKMWIEFKACRFINPFKNERSVKFSAEDIATIVPEMSLSNEEDQEIILNEAQSNLLWKLLPHTIKYDDTDDLITDLPFSGMAVVSSRQEW